MTTNGGKMTVTAPVTATVLFTIIDSPIGELLISGEHTDGEMTITGLYIPGHERRPGPGWVRADLEFTELRRQLNEYFSGERRDFDLRADAPGTPFQRLVWTELRRIDYGHTASYGEVALNIGAPTASRAVGGANGRNPISIIVPCHRVVGSNGMLTGYAGGLTAKSWLLAHERRHLGAADSGVDARADLLPFPQ
jgi:methylated-DNA-[protein]-cysteine S-methyltransferase